MCHRETHQPTHQVNKRVGSAPSASALVTGDSQAEGSQEGVPMSQGESGPSASTQRASPHPDLPGQK